MSAILQELRERIQALERSPNRTGVPGLSSGFPALDELLVHGGFQPGTLVEWIGPGAATLALRVAAHVLGDEGICLVIDETGEFYPPGVPLPLERTVIIRPGGRVMAPWVWEQSLRCPGVAVTFGWIDPLDDRTFRRLQLAAETGGRLGFLVRPLKALTLPSWAATRIVVSWSGEQLHVKVTRGQRGRPDITIEVELSDETCPLPLVSELADPAPAHRAGSRKRPV